VANHRQFWKQFFEASANVSLSGYEELAVDEELEDTAFSQSQGNVSTGATSTSQPCDDTIHGEGQEGDIYDQADDSLLDNGDVSGSTPRPPHGKVGTSGKPKFAEYPSPYEALKRELKGGSATTEAGTDGQQLPPTTPGTRQRLPDMSMTPTSSPFAPTSHLPSTTQRKGPDPLLHMVLDKNYRLTWKEAASPMSSPPAAATQLRSEIFSSPIRQQSSRPNAPRTPGVSIQTPAKGRQGDASSRRAPKDEITWESDSDQDADDIYKELGMSPPKTIQFAIAPSRLLQTPGKSSSPFKSTMITTKCLQHEKRVNELWRVSC
jgi:DASH complex subunit ASK1